MLARFRKAMNKDQGFTLIELLVVMIIIGILAAIAIPTFLNQQKNGHRTSLKTDLKNAATNTESYAVDNGGSYAGASKDATETQTGTDNTLTWTTATAGTTTTPATFCIQAVSTKLPSETWSIRKGGVPTKASC